MELVFLGWLFLFAAGGSAFAFFVLLAEKKKNARLAEVYAKLQVILAAPSTPRSGLVVFRGHIETDSPVVEPITGESCVWFHSTAFARRWVVSNNKGRCATGKSAAGSNGLRASDETGVVVCDGVGLSVGEHLSTR